MLPQFHRDGSDRVGRYVYIRWRSRNRSGERTERDKGYLHQNRRCCPLHRGNRFLQWCLNQYGYLAVCSAYTYLELNSHRAPPGAGQISTSIPPSLKPNFPRYSERTAKMHSIGPEDASRQYGHRFCPLDSHWVGCHSTWDQSAEASTYVTGAVNAPPGRTGGPVIASTPSAGWRHLGIPPRPSPSRRIRPAPQPRPARRSCCQSCRCSN